MRKNPRRYTAPCFIDEGTLINKVDMARALRTLENVRYSYIVDGQKISEGEGILVKVFLSEQTSTLVVNGCLFINVHSFDYLRFTPAEKASSRVELIGDNRILDLVPIEQEIKQGLSRQLACHSCPYEDEEENAAYLPEDFWDEEDD